MSLTLDFPIFPSKGRSGNELSINRNLIFFDAIKFRKNFKPIDIKLTLIKVFDFDSIVVKHKLSE